MASSDRGFPWLAKLRLLATRLALALVLTALSASGGRAAPILDQEFVPTRAVSSGLTSLSRAQTFTVGIDGILDSFEVYLEGNATRTFEIQATSGGVPVLGGPALASVVIDFDSPIGSPTFFSADVRSFGIAVSVGEVLAIVAPGEGTSNGRWIASSQDADGNPYPNGSYYSTNDTSPDAYVEQTGFDLGFRTFVVPEPSTALLLGAGLLGLASRGRRRR